MNRQKLRKEQEYRRFTCGAVDLTSNGKVFLNEKNKYKKHGGKKKYDISPNSYSMNWSSQSRFHPVFQRQFSTSESSVCHYSVPLSFSFEPVSLPIYPAVIQPQGVSLESYSKKLKNHGKPKNRLSINKEKSTIQHDSSAIFHSSTFNSGDQQDYASLPSVNCDIYAAKSSDTETVCKRRFSDPGIGQMSSDECSSIRSDDSNISSQTAEFQNNDFCSLVEQINELKESNCLLKKELTETKVELETFKMQSLTWKISNEDFKPGALSDAICEIRNAVKLGEEALMSRVVQILEKNSVDCKEAQQTLEEKIRLEMNEKLSRLEEKLKKPNEKNNLETQPLLETNESSPKGNNLDVQQQILELEKEKLQLRKELQEAVAKRKTAEATTEKLERLVGILRKKINGVSLESCIPDEKHVLVRPLASSLEKNPFIIANNRQGQKSDTLPFSKSKIPPFKNFTSEATDGTMIENKENENGDVVPGSYTSPEGSVTAQVTITGPVTDL